MRVLAYIVHLLQTPAVIPEGPAWAVAIVLIVAAFIALGNVVVKIIEAVNRKRDHHHHHDGERHGTRRNDDRQVTREEIEAEVEQRRMIKETHTDVSALAESTRATYELLERVTITMEGAARTRDLQTGLLDTVVRQCNRLEFMPTTADMLQDGSRTRHDVRNVVHEYVLTGKVSPPKDPPPPAERK